MDSDSRANPPRSSRPQDFLSGLAETTLYHLYSDLCAMAAKKTTPKSAPPKGKAKPAAKPSKSAPAKAKPIVKAAAPAKAKPVVKAAAPAKKPAEKAVKTVAPATKVVAEKPAKKAAPAPAPVEKAVKAPAEVIPAPVEVPAKASVPAKKIPALKPRSSVVDFPAPPAPVRPPFVPPKAAPAHADGPVSPGSNGSHSASFVQKQRQRLLDLRDDLVDAVSGMARDTIRNAPEGSEASGSGQHQGDAGSDAYDRDFALSVLAKEQDALYEIEQALYRIKNGSYGICEISSRKIPQARLEAIPFARLTVECQAQWEKEYGNRRFRPSNEVGFSGGNYVEDEDSETVSLDEDDD
jgi:DnaK suppressor protein